MGLVLNRLLRFVGYSFALDPPLRFRAPKASLPRTGSDGPPGSARPESVFSGFGHH